MLVSGLQNASLSTVISGCKEDFSRAYESLCECAQQMSDKYRQKQGKQVHSKKLEVKAEAASIMLKELSKVPKDSRVTREVLSSALERHIEALRGHEHLLSATGNSYELIKQTRRLRRYNDAPASLLRYHTLKNKFLGSTSPLSAEQKKIISELAKEKDLTLELLESMVKNLEMITGQLMTLEKEGLLEQNLYASIFKHKSLYRALSSLIRLYEKDLFKPHLCTAVLKNENPIIVAIALESLYEQGLFESDLWTKVVVEHETPFDAALILIRLDNADLLKLEPDFCAMALEHEKPDEAAHAIVKLKQLKLDTPDNLSMVLKQKNPYSEMIIICLLNKIKMSDTMLEEIFTQKSFDEVYLALAELNRAGMLKVDLPDLYTGVIEHESPEEAAEALVRLKQHKLDTPDNCSFVLKQKNPYSAMVIICLMSDRNMLMSDVMLEQIFAQKKPDEVYLALDKLNEAGMLKVDLPDLYTGVIEHESPEEAAEALVRLKQHKLDTPDNCSFVLKQENPYSAMVIICLMSDRNMLMSDVMLEQIFAQKKPDEVYLALDKLNEAGMLKVDLPDLYTGVIEHESPEEAAKSLVELKQHKLDTPDNCSFVLKQKNPYSAMIIICLMNDRNMLMSDVMLEQIFAQKKPGDVYLALNKLNEAGMLKVDLPDLYTGVIEHESPEEAAKSLVELKQHKLDTQGNCSLVLKRKDPVMAAIELVELESKGGAVEPESENLAEELDLEDWAIYTGTENLAEGPDYEDWVVV